MQRGGSPPGQASSVDTGLGFSRGWRGWVGLASNLSGAAISLSPPAQAAGFGDVLRAGSRRRRPLSPHERRLPRVGAAGRDGAARGRQRGAGIRSLSAGQPTQARGPPRPPFATASGGRGRAASLPRTMGPRALGVLLNLECRCRPSAAHRPKVRRRGGGGGRGAAGWLTGRVPLTAL